MTHYNDITPLSAIEEAHLWNAYGNIVPHHEFTQNPRALEALIRTLPVVRAHANFRTINGHQEPYVEVIGFIPVVRGAQTCNGQRSEEPRFLWISIIKGENWNECCMGDESGLENWNHMTR